MDEGNAWTDPNNWAGGTAINCAIGSGLSSDDPTKVRCPNGGSEETSCAITRKVCVTCHTQSTQVYIRFQSNGMPSHCYGSSDIPNAPKDQAIDFTVFWNRNVINAADYAWTEAQQDEEAEVDNILCQI